MKTFFDYLALAIWVVVMTALVGSIAMMLYHFPSGIPYLLAMVAFMWALGRLSGVSFK